MMKTRVFLLRHGETDANASDTIQGHLDYPLNDRGLFQADCAAERLKKESFDVIYSSDLSRAFVTAQKAAGGQKIISTPQLREWFLGHWQNLTLPQIKEKFPKEYALFAAGSPDFIPSGGESARDFQKRAGNFLDMLHEKHPGQKILCVSHGGTIKQMLKYVLKLEKFPQTPTLDNTGISCFSTQDGIRWQLVFWNDHAHIREAVDSTGW